MISIFNTGDHTGKRAKGRSLPQPDHFAACPDEGNVLNFYVGQFESVYVLLHPFIRAVSIDKIRFCPETYPSKSEILTTCVPVFWHEIVRIRDFRNINEVDIGLRTGIGGLKAEFADKRLADIIADLEAETNIIEPDSGNVSELLQNRLFEAAQESGHDWLWVADEFGLERSLKWFDDLKGDYNFPPHGNTFTPDKSILITTHWDSHFSFLCSSRETIERILMFAPFEGFFCDEKTEVYWSIRSPVVDLANQ
ncbi:MAG: DUF2711 family protein [Acidobacteriota bacterium]